MDKYRAQQAARRLLADTEVREFILDHLRLKYAAEWAEAGTIERREALWLRVQALADFERELRVLAEDAALEDTPEGGVSGAALAKPEGVQ